MLVETWRGTVQPHQCDILGHLNLQYYFACIGEGMFAFQMDFGLGPAQVKARQLSFAVVHSDSNFRAELVAGDIIALRSGVEKLGSKSATFYHRLMRLEDEACAFDVHFKCVLLDLATRKARDLPDDVRTKAQKFLVEPAEMNP
jgi:acyl-CoA thioesterase FadM